MKIFWIILAIGLILRIVLSLTTFHSDMQVFDLAGKLVASGNILNLYDFSSSSAVFNYPPAIYLLHGLFHFLFNILGLSQIIQFNLNLLLLKLPYLIFDLIIGFVLFKMFDSSKKSLMVFALWMFNPVNLYATYMMGQFDIIPTFFIVLSIYLAVKNKLQLSALSLGFGIAFKLFPIFLVIPLLILGKSFWVKIKLFAITMAPYLLSIIPYLSSHNFRATALFANQSSKSLYASVPVSGGEALILFPLFLLFYYLFIWVNRVRNEIWKMYMIPLLLFFIFTHFHPQWLIWMTPFLILDLVKSGFKNILPNLLIFVSWFSSLFFFDPSLTVGIFAPIWPQSQNLSSIWVILHLNPDYNFSRSIIQTVLAAAAFYFVYVYFLGKKTE